MELKWKIRIGYAWWTGEVKEAVREKTEVYMRTIQRNGSEELNERRSKEYVTNKRNAK